MESSQKPRTILITGGTGYLGSRLLTLARNWNLHATFNSTPPPYQTAIRYHKCDLRQSDAVFELMNDVQPSVIIHTACSNQTPHNLESIVPSALNLSRAAQAHQARLIHLSSDMVFAGEDAPYSETHRTNPITEYGQLKAQAERLIMTQNPVSLIVRTSLIYGTNPIDHQSRWMLKRIGQGETLCLFTDEIRCPIWIDTLALALLELANKPEMGILHVAGPQALTRWEFGQVMLPLLGQPPSPLLRPGTIEESGLVRPKNLTLNVTKAHQLLSTPLLTVKEVSTLLTPKG